MSFTCAECGCSTELIGQAPDGRMVCPVCLRKLKDTPGVGPSETKHAP
jgi:hypothetical protein